MDKQKGAGADRPQSRVVRAAKDVRVIAAAAGAVAAAVLGWVKMFPPKPVTPPHVAAAAPSVSAADGGVAVGGSVSGSSIVIGAQPQGANGSAKPRR